MTNRRWMTAAATLILCLSAESLVRADARTMYENALAREQAMRAASRRGSDPPLAQIRELIAAYELVVKRYPASGYADNSLYQGAMLAADAYRRLVDETDRTTAMRLLKDLIRRYPSSPLVARANVQLLEFAATATRPIASAPAQQAAAVTSPKTAPAVKTPPPATASPIPSATTVGPATTPAVLPAVISEPPPAPPVTSPPAAPAPVARVPAAGPVSIKDVKRIQLPEVVRVLIELEREVAYREERVDNPPRMFVDLKGVRAKEPLADAILSYPDDAVRHIRIGRHPQNTTRVVLDLNDVAQYSVFTLTNPFRIVIDCERRDGVSAQAAAVPEQPLIATRALDSQLASAEPVRLAQKKIDIRPDPPAEPIPSVVTAAKEPIPAPTPPAANLPGGFSLSRQLGLGVARIVIDAGHGGHDPGARGLNGVVEAELVLDIALRLEKMLQKETGVEVVMTRRADHFIPLEERTAIANREAADLFLSIHANASRNNLARGVETYYLNFASNPEAEAVAARENMMSGRTMNSLPDIVKAIALNNKLDESRDFASMVQQAMVQRLKAPNKPVRDLGVKQAPFVVLIGAAMPSVLAEISFVTNKQESALLKGPVYRQRIAEALFNAVVKYQRSLKSARSVAKREAQDR